MSTSKFPRRILSEKNPYYLNEFREREIIYFCLQYSGWKRRLSIIKLNLSVGEWADPTGQEAIERVLCARNMKIVEDACKRAYPEEWELLLSGVTDPYSNWYNFKLVKDMKCGRDRYYDLKHRVYYYVAQKDRV